MSETIPAPIDEAGQEGRTQVPVKIWLVFAAAGILLGHYLLHQLSISAESAVRLSEAQLMLAGAVPYVDFFDNASPFYIYFNLLPASLSQLMHLHPILIFNCLICLLFVLSALALISFSAVGTGRATWRNPLCGSKWLCLLAFVSLVLFQPVHFGQANQLFFIAMTPYIVCRALRLRGLRIGSKLAFLVGMAVGLCVLLDPLYAIFFLIFEASTVWGLYPFAGFALIKKRYLGPELQFALAIALLLGSVFALIPCACARHYILDVIPINLDGYIEVLNALCYAGNSSDLRPEIYLGGLCVMVAAPFLGRNLVARFFAVATLLSLALLIGQTGILHYQSYPMLAFGIMTIAALLSPAHLPAPLRRAAIFSWLSSRLSALLSRGIALTPVFSARPGLAPAAIVTVCAGLTYFGERASIGANDLYQLNRLGYYGVADKRDIGVLGDVVEMYSKPREAVAILGLGLRPGFPVLTQLRRKPGLALTWGFPLDILHIMEAPVYDKQMFAVKDFSDAIYKDMSRRLSLKEGAPVLVLVDEGEVRTLLDEHSVSAALEANYVSCGGASLLDESSTAGHPSMEYVGYKSGFGIYRHK